MKPIRIICLALLLGVTFCAQADNCFELENLYDSRPTNYLTRAGVGWIAIGAATEPTATMSFTSPYEYVMLTGGNKDTYPGQLEVKIQPEHGVDSLVFLIAKPCKTDYLSGASVDVYADNEAVFSSLVIAASQRYKEVHVPVQRDCKSLIIRVTNYYTNTTEEHNNRIAFAHFCWTDYEGEGTRVDTSYVGVYACYDQMPYVWHDIECIKAGTYFYTTQTTDGRDSVLGMVLTVSPKPETITETETVALGGGVLWHQQPIIPSHVGDTMLVDSIEGDFGCLAMIYRLNLHVVEDTTDLPCGTVLSTRQDTSLCEGDSFDWYGMHIDAPGVYSCKISSVAKDTCDSLHIRLYVAQKQKYSITEELTLCTAQTPYHWNGQDLTTSGTYTFTGSTADGCDSIVTLHLTVTEALHSDLTALCCPSELPYHWCGQVLTASGDYSQTYTAVAGCDSIVTLHLLVSPEAQQVTIDTTLARGQILSWRDIRTDMEGTYFDTIIARSAPFCDSVYLTLNLHYPPKPGPDTTVVPVTDTTHVTIRVCAEQMPYVWNGIACTREGEYTYSATNITGGDSIVILTLIVDLYSATDTVAFCYDNQLPFVWHGQELYATGTTTWQTTNRVGCDSIVTLHLYVDPAPQPQEECQPTSSVTQATICKGEAYVWHNRSFKSTVIVRDVLTNAKGCDSVCEFRLTVLPTPMGNQSERICFGDSVLVRGRWLKAGATYFDTIPHGAVNGCDSLCRVTIQSSAEPQTIRKAVYLEPTELPYSWRNQTLGGEGTYFDDVTHPTTGCDSLHYILDLHVLEACDPRPIIKK